MLETPANVLTGNAARVPHWKLLLVFLQSPHGSKRTGRQGLNKHKPAGRSIGRYKSEASNNQVLKIAQVFLRNNIAHSSSG